MINTVRSVFCAVSVSVMVGGCFATPDMSRWAENSSALATAISAENAEVLKRMDKNIGAYHAGVKIGWDIPTAYDTTWSNDSRKTYADAATTIDATMMVMTLYADALAKLAASGETGKEAVDKGHKALKSIADTVGVAFPAAPAVVAIVKEIADVWTRAEAQAGLWEAMELTDPKVEALRDEIKNAVNAQGSLVTLLRNFEVEIIDHSYGENVMLWYFQNDPTSGKPRFEKNEQIFADAIANQDDTVVAAAHTYLIETLKPRAEARARELSAVAQWRKARLKKLHGIAAAADAWRESHKDAMAALRECGGLRAFRFNCGGYTAENLKIWANRINDAVAGDGPSAADVDN